MENQFRQKSNRGRKMTLNEKLKHKYALSDYGAKGMLRAFVAVTLANLVLMLPVGLYTALCETFSAEESLCPACRSTCAL